MTPYCPQNKDQMSQHAKPVFPPITSAYFTCLILYHSTLTLASVGLSLLQLPEHTMLSLLQGLCTCSSLCLNTPLSSQPVQSQLLSVLSLNLTSSWKASLTSYDWVRYPMFSHNTLFVPLSSPKRYYTTLQLPVNSPMSLLDYELLEGMESDLCIIISLVCWTVPST